MPICLTDPAPDTFAGDAQRESDIIDFREHDASWLAGMDEAPTFHPTAEEFQDPLRYISSIQREAAAYGANKAGHNSGFIRSAPICGGAVQPSRPWHSRATPCRVHSSGWSTDSIVFMQVSAR